MKNLPPEMMYVLMIAAVVLFQYLMKRFGPQSNPGAEAQQGLPETPESLGIPFEAPAGIGVGRGSVQTKPSDALSDLKGGRYSRLSLMGSRRKVQNAIVVAAILGPCRASDPYETR